MGQYFVRYTAQSHELAMKSVQGHESNNEMVYLLALAAIYHNLVGSVATVAGLWILSNPFSSIPADVSAKSSSKTQRCQYTVV